MRFRRTTRVAACWCLLSLLGVLATGLPTHHHEVAASELREEGQRAAPLHHSHGSELVEQDERVVSSGPLVVFDAIEVGFLMRTTSVPLPVAVTAPIRPTGRAPPPVAPRAPPLTV
ncbi:MAG: hypothetical protein ABFS34_02860 [Gemmatimonadota bacterium]